jgi:hypothetical protein
MVMEGAGCVSGAYVSAAVLIRYFLGDVPEEGEMGRACSAYGGLEKLQDCDYKASREQTN